MRVTAVLPLELGIIMLGFQDGFVRRTDFEKLCVPYHGEPFVRTSDLPLAGYISVLHVVDNGRTKERFLIGGADDGSVALWNIDSLRLCARWILFTTVLSFVVQFPDVENCILRGCAVCVAEDGTIAVLALDGFEILYMLPGSVAPLDRMCLHGDSLLLTYADRRARVWDIKTKEISRSMGVDKAEELIHTGGWTRFGRRLVRVKPDMFLVSTVTFDIERFLSEAMTIIKSISTNKAQTRTILSTRARLCSLLSALLTPGLNEGIDVICSQRLGAQPSTAHLGFHRHVDCLRCSAQHSHKGLSVWDLMVSADLWCISGSVSASRAVSIVAVLRALSLFEEYAESATTVTIFYATSLGPCVGSSYFPPDLAYLSHCWFESSIELRHSVHVVFNGALSCLSDDEANEVVDAWQHHLPWVQPETERDSSQTASALFICGYLAAERYALLSTQTLTDIAKSISCYLHDGNPINCVLAIDLSARGFQVWQHYIDAVEILRALFNLATATRKDSISLQNVGSQARAAVLQIAGSDTPLFMTTLGLDILNPVSTEHRKSVMQVVAFLIRKRPLVLHPNLPRLMEAVVKSLDPNTTGNRDALQDSATEILRQVVKTFPSVDFHMRTQRLAVGTNEGALVMYDLKTAVRLYVLEKHKRRITACSFSPDGRRLLTVSLEESVVLVWKVGSSIAGFFNPGAPPGGSTPFKTIPFNIGDKSMTLAETLSLVHFEWTGDRSVRLKIQDITLSFSA
ncbi:WD40 repeat-like protein [Fistulina hepatica ATCC 64428]|uniref:WD40 repeat-like protein n=1 Tax=Fistulina hepatica ATCC 64428 TaxID=1128425 RepID=A0A0D7AM91_9AGAR|nr:WD40 repeat-like protein [Fistulina hepatica ATCC 64428]